MSVPSVFTLAEEDLRAIPEGPDFEAEAVILKSSPAEELASDRSRRYMQTTLRLSPDVGAITGTTRTWTMQPWIGFTGAIKILLARPDGQYLAETPAMQYGVDGFRYEPFLHSDRSEPWTQFLSPEVTRQVQSEAQIEIVHAHKSKYRLDEQMKKMETVGKTVAAIAAVLRGPG